MADRASDRPEERAPVSPLLRRPGRIKRLMYWMGHRPKPGTIRYSPSLAMRHARRDYERKNR